MRQPLSLSAFGHATSLFFEIALGYALPCVWCFRRIAWPHSCSSFSPVSGGSIGRASLLD
jgi:hypothetical protein